MSKYQTSKNTDDVMWYIVVVIVIGIVGIGIIEAVGLKFILSAVGGIIGEAGVIFSAFGFFRRLDETKQDLFANKTFLTISLISSIIIGIFSWAYYYGFGKIKNYVVLFFSDVWTKIIIFKMWIILVIIGIFCIIFILYLIKSYKRKIRNFKCRIDEINNKKCNGIETINTIIQELSDLIEEHPKIANIFLTKIMAIKQELENKREELKTKREEKQKAKEKSEKEYQRKIINIRKLIDFFDQNKSDNSIPDWALKFDSEMIESAKEAYAKRVEKRTKIQKMKNEAEEFVLEHKGYPTDFSELTESEQNIYIKAMNDFKEGKLQPKAEIEEVEEPVDPEFYRLLNNKFYRAADLSAEERDWLMKKQGYKHVSFTHLNGKIGNNLIIKNDNKSEGDYHFCVKHLFYKEYPEAQMEYTIDDFRADLAFILDKDKIAIEIESGTNKELQIQRKVEWLNKQFNRWMFVCPRDYKPYYRKFVDNQKSFCFTLAEASSYLRTIIFNIY